MQTPLAGGCFCNICLTVLSPRLPPLASNCLSPRPARAHRTRSQRRCVRSLYGIPARLQGNLFQAVSPHTIRGHKAWRCTALKRLQPLLMSGLSRHQARTSCRRYPRKQVSPLIHALAVAGQSAPSPSASTAPASELHLSPQRRLRSHFWMQPRRRIEAHLWLEEAQQCCKVLRARIAFLRVCAVAPTAF